MTSDMLLLPMLMPSKSFLSSAFGSAHVLPDDPTSPQVAIESSGADSSVPPVGDGVGDDPGVGTAGVDAGVDGGGASPSANLARLLQHSDDSVPQGATNHTFIPLPNLPSTIVFPSATLLLRLVPCLIAHSQVRLMAMHWAASTMLSPLALFLHLRRLSEHLCPSPVLENHASIAILQVHA